MRVLRRGVRAFGLFWWDFLVGDTPELFVAVALIVALALLLRHHHDIAIIVLPVVTVVFLLVSAFRGRQRTGRRGKPKALRRPHQAERSDYLGAPPFDYPPGG